jgi:hypothetical protein
MSKPKSRILDIVCAALHAEWQLVHMWLDGLDGCVAQILIGNDVELISGGWREDEQDAIADLERQFQMMASTILIDEIERLRKRVDETIASAAPGDYGHVTAVVHARAQIDKRDVELTEQEVLLNGGAILLQGCDEPALDGVYHRLGCGGEASAVVVVERDGK